MGSWLRALMGLLVLPFQGQDRGPDSNLFLLPVEALGLSQLSSAPVVFFLGLDLTCRRWRSPWSILL